MSECVSHESRGSQPVFYLGPEGTFSHILARHIFGPTAPLSECPTLENVVECMVGHPGGMGLLPIENSSGGTVYDSIDVLIRHAGNLAVVAEAALDVRIALLRRGTGSIRTIYSHFTQLKHHAEWLAGKFPHAKLKGVDSTADAARRAATEAGAAALASPGAAPIYGLDIAEMPPSPRGGNVTHFFSLRSGAPQPCLSRGKTKTALSVALPNVCGSLHSFLGPFARHRVSLTRIVSRPVRGKPQTYTFFVEIEGDPRLEPVARALRAAERLAERMISFGSFPCAKRYKS